MIKTENPKPCPLGCIFHEGKLHGDCRIPWSKECFLNRETAKATWMENPYDGEEST